MISLPLITGCAAGIGLLAYLSKGRCQAREDKSLREHLTEKQVDKMVKDSFPASDPPSTY